MIPEKADAYAQTLEFKFSDDENIFYTIRNSVAVIDKHHEGSLSLSLSSDAWYDLLSKKKNSLRSRSRSFSGNEWYRRG